MYIDKRPWNIAVILSVVILLLKVRYGHCVERLYYMAVIEEEWNYAPTGANHQNSNRQPLFDFYVKNNPNTIGGTYKKAMFRHFTDETFSTEWPQPAHMAITGPIIRAEVGDTLKIIFKNKASRSYSFHAQGVSYLKGSEGALYVDGTSGSDKYDDFVRPGTTQTYIWTVRDENGPSLSDPPCIPWVYRSHVNSPRDTNTGLVGVLLTCKNGTLNYDHTRNDVNTELVVFNKAFDENQSWYIESDLNRCGTATVCETLRATGEVDFVKSNIMKSINGRGFSNLNGLTACAGDKVAWYFLTVGNEKDINTMFIEGQIMDIQQTRSSTASVYPGTAVVGFMIPRNPGTYGVYSMAEDNFGEGLSAPLTVEDCFRVNATLPTPTKERTYYMSIEEHTWNYGPSGFDMMTNKSLTEPGTSSALFFDSTNGLGGNYKKMEYILYTDENYGQKVNRSPIEQHLGLLGPPLRVEEGETVNLMLRNQGEKQYSFVGQSLYYNPSDSGYSGGNTMGVLFPGSTHTYKFQVPENIVQADDPNCVVRLYYSADDFAGDVNTGLIGPLLICRPGTLTADNKPITVEKEFFLLFKNFDESKTSFFQSNIQEFATNQSVDQFNARFQLSNKRQSINGYSYGNLPMLAMCKGENVILHMMTLGNSDEDVSVHFHGNTLNDRNTTRDTVGLISGMTKTMTMNPEALGIWGIVSTIQEHYLMGMSGRYSVDICVPASGATRAPAPTAIPQTPIKTATRRYAIGAVEVDWNYAVNAKDVFTGVDLNDPRADANTYIKNDNSYIGSVYKKAVYRGYADTGFKQQINRGFDVNHLGILGPVIKAEVGENIEIFFKNLVNSTRKFSIQPHGVQLDKDNEEFYYEDGQRHQPRVGVGYDEAKIYRWSVPASAGPGPNDPNCITWLYYSAIDKVRDVESGLIGPLQICRKGTLNNFGQRKDVNREFHLLFKKFNENQSWFFDENILSSAPGRVGTDFTSDLSFEESNKMFSVNGESNGNLKGLAMLENETVSWNFYAIGDNEAFNTVRVNGNTFSRPSEQNARADTMELYPGTSESVIMEANNAGKWLITSDISTHVTKGMSATYQVLQPSGV